MTPTVDSDARIAWGAAAALNATLFISVLAMFIAFPAPLGSMLTALRLAQLISAITWLLVLARKQSCPRLGASLAAFALAPLPYLLMYSFLAAAHEASRTPFEPLLRQTMAVIVIGILSPRQVWVTITMIAAFAVEACLEYWISGFGASKNYRPHEPWLTVGTAALATWVAISRARILTRERTLTRQLRETKEAARMAKLALAVLDLANTPLQVIELQLTLLEERHQPAPPEAILIRRAVGRLVELNRLLSTYVPDANWVDVDDSLESFNAMTVLRELRRQP
jgi:hypothetical protein